MRQSRASACPIPARSKLIPMEPFYFESGSVRTVQQNEHDFNEAKQRGKTAEWRETRFKSNADVASRITFLRSLSRFFCFSSCESTFNHSCVFGKKRERKRFPFRPLILSTSNFECKQKKKSGDGSVQSKKGRKRKRDRDRECAEPLSPNINSGMAVCR